MRGSPHQYASGLAATRSQQSTSGSDAGRAQQSPDETAGACARRFNGRTERENKDASETIAPHLARGQAHLDAVRVRR